MTTVVAAVLLVGCTQTVAGSGVAAPATAPRSTTPSTPSSPAAPTGSSAPRSDLEVDVVDDECLLNASEFGALIGQAVRPPEQGDPEGGTGTTGSSCVANVGDTPLAMINVYRVRSGTAAEYVRAGAGGRDLPETGEAAAVFETEAGPTLQVASDDFLVTILVSGATPTQDGWRTAATAALTRLPE